MFMADIPDMLSLRTKELSFLQFTELTTLIIQILRYKDYKLLRSEAVDQGRLLVEPGSVREFGSTKGLVSELVDCKIVDVSLIIEY